MEGMRISSGLRVDFQTGGRFGFLRHHSQILASGYKRALILPDQASVPQFPLMAGASGPSALGGQQQPDASWDAGCESAGKVAAALAGPARRRESQ
jgi:hypothetical protein